MSCRVGRLLLWNVVLLEECRATSNQEVIGFLFPVRSSFDGGSSFVRFDDEELMAKVEEKEVE